MFTFGRQGRCHAVIGRLQKKSMKPERPQITYRFFFPRQSTLHIITAARAWWVGKWWVYAPYITNRKPTQPESVDYACMVACMVTVTI